MSNTLQHHSRYRFRLEDPNAHRERAFADEWEKAQENEFILVHLATSRPLPEGAVPMFPGGGWEAHPSELTQRDAEVAATVIQWLGTNVGYSFLLQALGKAGYKVIQA